VGLPGYPGGTDVVGNHVRKQFQLDAFGEALLLLSAAAARHDRLDTHHRQAMTTAVSAIEQRQLRGNLPQAFVHAVLLEASVRLAGPWPGHDR
jgi:hypothetical protein